MTLETEKLHLKDAFTEFKPRPGRKKLKELQENFCGALVPDEIHSILPESHQIKVIQMNTWIGTMDNGYEPQLDILVVSKNTKNVFEEKKPYSSLYQESLDYRTERAIKKGSINPEDEVVLSLIADGDQGIFRKGKAEGVEILSFILAKQFRRIGLGTMFYDHLGEIFKTVGFQYMYGQNDANNIHFFLARNRYRISELKRLPNGELPHIDILGKTFSNNKGETQTIEFLDKELERTSVEEKFLH
jgi:hypothetical protein